MDMRGSQEQRGQDLGQGIWMAPVGAHALPHRLSDFSASVCQAEEFWGQLNVSGPIPVCC